MVEAIATVMFATRNGSAVLRQTLEAYCLLGQRTDWQLVVVDNGSDDDTLDILRSFETRLPLTVYTEARPGKNAALNTGLRFQQETGMNPQIYIFTDDDALPVPGFIDGWISQIESRPDHAIFGGLVLPEFMQAPPSWLEYCSSRFAELYAQNDRDEGPIEARSVFGPNMAVRGEVIARGIRFDEEIGPNGSQTYAMGSETEFCVRLERDHHLKAWFTRATTVKHLVRPWQTSQEFYSARAYRHGRGFAMQQIKASRAEGLTRMLINGAIGRWVSRIEMIIGREDRRYDALWQYNWWRGYLTERVSALRESADPPPGFFKRRLLALELAIRSGFGMAVTASAPATEGSASLAPSLKTL